METKQIETIVPAKKVMTTMYSCSSCGFQSYSKESVVNHELSNHSYLDDKYIDDLGHAYLFGSEQASRIYWEHIKPSLRADGYNEYRISFNGPGWYFIRSEEEPCGRGCCTKNYYWIEHISKTIAEIEAYKQETIQDIDATLESLVGLSK